MLKLNELLDVEKLNEHLREGTVGRQFHPTLPLVIFNYTQKAQFTPGIWGDDVIDYCRGLIVNTVTDEIVARPFKKFHNLDTPSISESMVDNIVVHFVNTPPVVTEKMDGSLGIFWRFNEDHWGIATRGSFTSPQAQWANKWYAEQVIAGKLQPFSGAEYTPLFEIIYKENQIVVDYDFEGLVLIGAVSKRYGYEHKELTAFGADRGFTGNLVVKDYGKVQFGRKFWQTLPQSEANREGFVLSFDKGQESPLKVKVKFEEYTRLHKILTGMNPRSLWEIMANGDDKAIMRLYDKSMPEGFKKWTAQWVAKLAGEYNLLYDTARRIYENRPPGQYGDMKLNRKQFALYFITETQTKYADQATKLQPILFAMLDGNNKKTNQVIWKLIEPRGDDKTFRIDGE